MDQASHIDQTNDVDRSNSYSAWLCRVQLETACQADQAWPQLNSQNQGKHNSQRNEQYCEMFRRFVSDTNLGACSKDTLDLSEYPELGERRTETKNRPDRIVLSPEIVMPHVDLKGKHRKLVGQNRSRRMEKMSFYFRRAFANTENYTLKDSKLAMKLRASICKVNTNPINKNSNNEKVIEIKKVKIYNIKPKNPSSLKRKILLQRCISRQRERRMKKIEANATDVNSINFNTLKIKSDPEIDIDYVKRMSTLTVYDTDYRNLNVDNIPEDTVQYRPDLTQKLDGLRISNLHNTNISTTNYKNSLDNTDDLNILQSTLSLQTEDEADHKPDIKPLFHNEIIKYSKNFREYCNNLVTSSLNESLEKFLSEIKRLQTKLYGRDPKKGKYRRRYYSGLKEVQKYVVLRKIRFVIVAPDIEKVQTEGGLDDEIDKLLEICRKNATAFCFGLRRRKLGYYAHGNGFVACIGITNYGNVEDLFWNVLVEVAEARNKFEELRGRSDRTIDVSEITEDNGLLSENITTLMRTLASIT